MNRDYRMVRLTDGTTIMGSIVVDKDFLRITNALELNTVKRSTEMGMKDDSTLAPWLPFTDDKTFVIPRDKILVITQADQHISHYYEVILKKVQQDKEREAQDGFDGSWVAHPDLVPVCTEVFSKTFEEGHVNQKHRMREDVQISSEMLLEFQIPGGKITESGLRNNVSVGIQYIAAWLGGTGAVAIFNLMEDAATAEISRSQIWQWCRHPQGKLEDGRKITNELVLNIIPEELAKIRESYGGSYNEEKMKQATDLFISLVSEEAFEEFLTIRAYDQLD